MSRRPSNRRGYALVLVMVFVVLFSAVLGVAWCRVASALRIEHVSEVRQRCDRGSLQVAAKAMQVLETCLRQSNSGTPRISRSDAYPLWFRCPAQISHSTHWYKIAFSPDNGDSSGTQWSVSVTAVAQADEDYNSSSLPILPSGPP